MKGPLSSPSSELLRFSLRRVLRTLTVAKVFAPATLPLVARVMPPKRTRMLRQNLPSFALRNRRTSTSLDWRLPPSRLHAPDRAGVRCLRQTSIRVGTRLCPCEQQAEAPQAVFAHGRSAEAWYRDDPSVTRPPRGKPVSVFDRPDQSSTRRCRRSPCSLVLFSCALVLPSTCLGKRSRLCRRATDEEYPGRRRTKGAGRRGRPAPAPPWRPHAAGLCTL
jgi:hypothetical protein